MMLRKDMELEVFYLIEKEARDCDRTINRTFLFTCLAWTARWRARDMAIMHRRCNKSVQAPTV